MDLVFQWERLKRWWLRQFGAERLLSWKFHWQNFCFLRFGFLYPHHRRLRHRYVICSASYNVGPYIDEFFRSIVWQSADFQKSIHIVSIDDGSTDNTAAIIQKWQRRYPQNITYLYKKNGGVSSARNVGLRYIFENIDADFITFGDPDDFFDSRYFFRTDRGISQCPCPADLSCVACFFIPFFANEKRYTLHSGCAFKYGPVAELADVYSYKNVNFGLGYTFLPFAPLRLSNVFFSETISYLEDAIFASQFQLHLPLSQQHLLLPHACYFYRRKENGLSTELKFLSNPSFFLEIPLILLSLLQEKTLLPQGRDYWFIDRFIILHFNWFFCLINNPEFRHVLDLNVVRESLRVVYTLLSYISVSTIERVVAWQSPGKVYMLAFKKGMIPINEILVDPPLALAG
ncbi:MAG: glycosyltransferase family 2 protein [Puniceicoccales bacterium]|jgi:glycosyltransferase involved in cell wall biosynthesis|nr:glycosyltransferase family 2 protein [Puniceicoccales bacterium]